MLHYTTTASGQKIRQQLIEDGRVGTQRDYAGPFVYINNQLAWINTPHGRVIKKEGRDQGTFELIKEFHVRDHLGNTRLVLEKTGINLYTPSHVADYYPFGMKIQRGLLNIQPPAGNLLNNRYLYNGKEFQDDFGLNWYDYGARFYDPQIARWHSVDPLAEFAYSITPYRYAYNNPVRISDPDGQDDFFDVNGNFIERKGSGTNIIIGGRQLSETDFSGNIDRAARIIRHYYTSENLGRMPSRLRNDDITIVNLHRRYDRERKTTLYSERHNDVVSEYYGESDFIAAARIKGSSPATIDHQIMFQLTRGEFKKYDGPKSYTDDFNNVISLLVHEEFHLRQGPTNSAQEREVQAYSYQISHNSFRLTTLDFKKFTIRNVLGDLNSLHKAGHNVQLHIRQINRGISDVGIVELNRNNNTYDVIYY